MRSAGGPCVPSCPIKNKRGCPFRTTADRSCGHRNTFFRSDPSVSVSRQLPVSKDDRSFLRTSEHFFQIRTVGFCFWPASYENDSRPARADDGAATKSSHGRDAVRTTSRERGGVAGTRTAPRKERLRRDGGGGVASNPRLWRMERGTVWIGRSL